jgi:septum formation protein
MLNTSKRILLASKSPRRLQLLQQLGFAVELVHQDIAEDFPADLDPREVPAFLARLKSSACVEHLRTDSDILLASDTIVLMDGEIFHKPTDFEDGKRILNRLQGRMHEVVTGVCLRSKHKTISFSDIAKVYFAPMSADEIAYYLHTYKPYDKAGAYAIQEWIGAAKITRMEGSYTTIMGLPTHLVYEHLQTF